MAVPFVVSGLAGLVAHVRSFLPIPTELPETLALHPKDPTPVAAAASKHTDAPANGSLESAECSHARALRGPEHPVVPVPLNHCPWITVVARSVVPADAEGASRADASTTTSVSGGTRTDDK